MLMLMHNSDLIRLDVRRVSLRINISLLSLFFFVWFC